MRRWEQVHEKVFSKESARLSRSRKSDVDSVIGLPVAAKSKKSWIGVGTDRAPLARIEPLLGLVGFGFRSVRFGELECQFAQEDSLSNGFHEAVLVERQRRGGRRGTMSCLARRHRVEILGREASVREHKVTQKYKSAKPGAQWVGHHESLLELYWQRDAAIANFQRARAIRTLAARIHCAPRADFARNLIHSRWVIYRITN